MTSKAHVEDAEARQLRAERTAAMALRNAYNDTREREKLTPGLRMAVADLLAADEILTNARDEMNRRGTY